MCRKHCRVSLLAAPQLALAWHGSLIRFSDSFGSHAINESASPDSCLVLAILQSASHSSRSSIHGRVASRRADKNATRRKQGGGLPTRSILVLVPVGNRRPLHNGVFSINTPFFSGHGLQPWVPCLRQGTAIRLRIAHALSNACHYALGCGSRRVAAACPVGVRIVSQAYRQFDSHPQWSVTGAPPRHDT